MSHPNAQSSNVDFEYIGSELEVFANAVNWKHYLASLLEPFIQGNVLEVGAGIGATTRVLATGLEVSWTCLEPDAILAARLEDLVKEDSLLSRLPLQVVAGSVADLPSSLVFDCILYVDVLEHIRDDDDELRRAAQHLSSQGYLVVLSPAHQWLFSPFDEAIGHCRRYSRKTLQGTGPEGLRLVELRYLDSVGLLASLGNRILLRSSSPSHGQVHFWDRFMVPISRIVDFVLRYRLGKSILAVWCRY